MTQGYTVDPLAPAKPESEWRDLASFLLKLAIVVFIIRSFIFSPFSIPSESMLPRLLIGDYLFITKWNYGYSKHSLPFSLPLIPGRVFAGTPERGDVVVFKAPGHNGEDWIKRVIGLPGDTVQMRNGQIILNGQPVPQDPNGTFEETFERQGPLGQYPQCENRPVGEGGVCTLSRATETLPNGVSHDVLNIVDNGPADNTPELIVPEGHYFFMGDHRDNSLDSRFSQGANGVGMVPAEFLVGRADRIMFSSAGRSLFFFWTWRADRFFKAVE